MLSFLKGRVRIDQSAFTRSRVFSAFTSLQRFHRSACYRHWPTYANAGDKSLDDTGKVPVLWMRRIEAESLQDTKPV